MHRIDSESAVGGLFVPGDPQAGQPPTAFTPEWCTDLQENVAGVIEAAGLSLSKGNYGQLALAIQLLTGGAPAFRNHLINGDFGVRQRDETLAPIGALPASTDTQTLDCWIANPGTKPSCLNARDSYAVGQSSVPGNPRHFLRYASSSATSGGAVRLMQRIEGVNTLAGQNAAISAYMAHLGTLSITGVQARLRQHFGTGGSPSADVVTDFADSWDVDQAQNLFLRFSSTVAVPTIAGKTLGTNGDDYLELEIDLGTQSSTFSFGIGDVQLEEGLSATAYQRLPFDVELSRCQRYYEKSYEQDTAPGAATVVGSAVTEENSGSTKAQGLATRFRVAKAKTPTVTWYNTDGTVDEVDNASTAKTVTSSDEVSKEGTGYPSISGTGTGQFNGHWVAEAAL